MTSIVCGVGVGHLESKSASCDAILAGVGTQGITKVVCTYKFYQIKAVSDSALCGRFKTEKMAPSYRLHMWQSPHKDNGTSFSRPHSEAPQLSLSLFVFGASHVATPTPAPS